MRRFKKNRYGTVSPVEFTLGMVVFISSFIVVTGTITPSFEQENSQDFTIAGKKAVEIANLLINPSSDVGLVVDSNVILEMPETTIGTQIEEGVDLELSLLYYSPAPGTPADDITVTYEVKNLNTVIAEGSFDYDITLYDDENNVLETFSGTENDIEIIKGESADSFSHDISLDSLTEKWNEGVGDFPLRVDITRFDDEDTSNNFKKITLHLDQSPNSDPPSIEGEPDPGDGQEEVPIDTKLVVRVLDPNNDDLTVIFYNGANDEEIDNVVVHLSGGAGIAECEWSSLDYDSEYRWYVTVSDSYHDPVRAPTTQQYWSFNTESIPANSPPDTPRIIDFDDFLFVYQEGEFEAWTTDPDGDDIQYLFDWGDGRIDFTGWLPSGISGELTHIYRESGSYELKVAARDASDLSGWTRGITIHVVGLIEDKKCFLRGTEIVMRDGSLTKIENLNIGDRIKSYDFKSNTIKNDEICDIHYNTPEDTIYDHYFLINNELKVTPDHPIYVNGQWKQVYQLKIGDPILIGRIYSIEKIYDKQPNYNIETKNYHNYLVKFGNELLIAHNGDSYQTSGYYEESNLASQKSASTVDRQYVLHLDKIFELNEKSYSELKDLFDLPDKYNYQVKIHNKDSMFLNKYNTNSNYIQSSVYAIHSKRVVIFDDYSYATATLDVIIYF